MISIKRTISFDENKKKILVHKTISEDGIEFEEKIWKDKKATQYEIGILNEQLKVFTDRVSKLDFELQNPEQIIDMMKEQKEDAENKIVDIRTVLSEYENIMHKFEVNSEERQNAIQ